MNASPSPGLWQCYATHIQRAFVEEEKVIKPATITMYHNNVLVQDHVPFVTAIQAGTLRLPDHLNPVRLRYIWFRATR